MLVVIVFSVYVILSLFPHSFQTGQVVRTFSLRTIERGIYASSSVNDTLSPEARRQIDCPRYYHAYTSVVESGDVVIVVPGIETSRVCIFVQKAGPLQRTEGTLCDAKLFTQIEQEYCQS